jgi:hypothetical protein
VASLGADGGNNGQELTKTTPFGTAFHDSSAQLDLG